MKILVQELRAALAATLGLMVLLCGAYPFAVWAVGQAAFPLQAGGSLAQRQGAIIGSELIGQNFTGPGYFHPRPSAAGAGYDAAGSGGSNLGPLSKQLADTVAVRIADFRRENDLDSGTPVPADAVTASGSGLDPDISIENAMLQAPRVARARATPVPDVQDKIRKHLQGPDLFIFGPRRVNVLALNLSLDAGHGRR